MKDVEEDLDMLQLKPIGEANQNETQESDMVNYYKKKLAQSDSKVDELVDMVSKLRFILRF